MRIRSLRQRSKLLRRLKKFIINSRRMVRQLSQSLVLVVLKNLNSHPSPLKRKKSN